MQKYQLKIAVPFEAASVHQNFKRIFIDAAGGYVDIDEVVFKNLFEPYVEPLKQSKEPAWQRAQRLQAAAIAAAQEAVNESIEAAKHMKEIFDGFIGKGG